MNDKQLFEREYMGTFEPRHGPPRRPRLAAVLAALTDDDPQWWEWQIKHTERWDFHHSGVVTHGVALARHRRDGALFWHRENDSRGLARPITPAEAWELLAARDLIPASWVDNSRRFGVRTARGRTCYNCPPPSKSKHCPLCDNTRIVAATLSTTPPTLADVVAFASLDHEAVDRAELLAIEHVGTARLICWRFGAVDPETASAHGYRQEPGQAIAGLGFGFALAPRDTPLHPYKILVCPPL